MESISEIEIFRKKGNEAFEKKDFSNAETFYLKALELNKNDVKTLSNLSACYYNLNNQSESIKYAKECIKIDSNWFKGYFRLALSYQALKEDELAFINAIKCFVCDKSTKKNLSDKFQLDNYSLDSMSIVKDQKDLDRILAEWTFFNSPFIFVINDCNVCFHDYDFINGKILIVGFKNSKIETSFQDATAINFSKSECIISSLYIDANKGGNAICTTFSKIQIYDCLFSGISKKSGACICLTMSSLKMRNSKIDGCVEAGLIVAGKSSADIKDCEVLKTGQDIGSGIEIRDGGSANIDSTHISYCKQGLLIWMNPGNVTINNCVISNNLSEGLYIEKISNQSFIPSLMSDKQEHQITKIIGNKIINNSTFGVTTDNYANSIILNNEIANNGCSGVIIKGNANTTMKGNYIHSNKLSGIEIGINYGGNIFIQENILKNNKKKAISNIYDISGSEINMGNKPILLKNTIDETYAENFSNFKISANRPSTRMACFTNFQYTCGNSFAKDLLSDISSQKDRFDVYLGGFCDIRHVLETVFHLDNNNNEKIIHFHLNDINITVIARFVFILYSIQKLNKELLTENLTKLEIALDLLMIWVSPKIYKHQKTFLIEQLNELINITKSIESAKKDLPWLELLSNYETLIVDLNKAFSIWKNSNLSVGSLLWHGKIGFMAEDNLQNILNNYLKINDQEFTEFDSLRHGQLVSSLSIKKITNEKYKNEPNEVNPSVLTIPSLSFDVYDSTSIFRSFELPTEKPDFVSLIPKTVQVKESKNSYNNYIDKLISHLHPRLVALSESLNRLKVSFTFDQSDLLDSLLLNLDNTSKFDVIDCSNVGEYLDPLVLLLSAASRLKNSNDSYISMHFMRIPRHSSGYDAIQKCFGLSFGEINKYFNLKCSTLKAYAGYIETIWLKDQNLVQLKHDDIKDLLKKLFQFLKENKNKSTIFKRYFSATSFVKVLQYIYCHQESSLVISTVKEEIVNHKNENFFLELSTFLNMQLNDVYQKALIHPKDDVVYLSLEMNFLDKNFLVSTQVLKLNEYEVHLIIYDDKNEKAFQKLTSFVFEIKSYEKFLVSFFCLRSFMEKNKKNKIQLCSKEFNKLSKPKTLNEASISEAKISKWFV